MHKQGFPKVIGVYALLAASCPWAFAADAVHHAHAAHAAAASPAPPAAAAPAPAATAPAANAAPAAAGGDLPTLAAPLNAAQVIQVLDQTVDWYRTLGQQQQASNEPSDLLFLYDNRQIANKVMTLAFDIARADADMLSREKTATPEPGADPGISAQALVDYRGKLNAQDASVQQDLESERRQLETAPKASRTEITARINELQGLRELITTKQDILNSMMEFVTGAGGSSAGSLKAQIDAMAVAIPSAAAPPAAAPTPSATAPAPAASASLLGPTAPSAAIGRFGLWDMVENAYRLSQKSGTITSIDRRTAALHDGLGQIRTPLVNEIKLLSARGDALAAQAESADSATLNGVHDQLDALSREFKQASAILLPLSREGILLGQYRHNLASWRLEVEGQYHDALEAVGIRVGLLLAVLAVLFGAASVWRRMVMRYVQDSRRRYQLLLLRRIALWSLVVVVIGFAFASELGSLVTFAGLITAGIAVAMQSVLVSIVGYFFLIGKYGIKVGDRVQIGEVAGEVIDLGLVRMYLMELGAKGAAGPTGRVVAFANSVVFQVSSGLFKQIPGVNFTWREVALRLPAGADYSVLKERLLAAATQALEQYRPELLRQTQEIERTTLSSSAGGAEPQVQLQFSTAGVEAHVRYPVHLGHAAEIDERVTQALARVLSEAGAAAGTAA